MSVYNKSGQYLVKPHNPRRAWMVRSLFFILLVGLCLLSYNYGQVRGGYQNKAAEAMIEAQTEQVNMLNARIDELLLENAQLASNMTIDATANKQVSQRLREYNEEILELKEELVFYRSLLTPADLEPGLQILGMQLAQHADSAAADGSAYSYKIVLTQRRSRYKFASGRVDLQLSGMRSGREVTLYAEDLVDGSKEALAFQFKNFQSLEGKLVVPEGFEPQTMLISVLPEVRGLKQVERSFDWKSIVSGG
jgi:hypothetical protein